MASEHISLPPPFDWFPHQVAAINQCIEIERAGATTAALDMPMGFGKTLVMLTLVMVMQSGITLWLCEKTLTTTVKADIRKFYPTAYIGHITSADDISLPPPAPGCRGFIIVTYTSFEQLAKPRPRGTWALIRRILDVFPIIRIVCDEAQRLVGRRKDLLTTTHMRIWFIGVPAGTDIPAVRPDVSSITMPPYTVEHIAVNLSPAEQALYSQHAQADASPASRAAMLRLCMHPPIELTAQGVVSPKVLFLERAISMMRGTDEKMVVFCRMQCMLEAIRCHLGYADDVVFIDGGSKADSRADAIEAFTTGTARVLVMTHLGTVGLNLVCARTVVFMDMVASDDPVFSAGLARVRRIGQDRACRVLIVTAMGC